MFRSILECPSVTTDKADQTSTETCQCWFRIFCIRFTEIVVIVTIRSLCRL